MAKGINRLWDMWDLLPDTAREGLEKAAEEYREKGQSRKTGSIRSCPHCGHRNTSNCEQIPGVADATIGICFTCGFLWCLECATALLTTVNCGHWAVCGECNERKDASGYCGRLAWECDHVKAWIRKTHPSA
jgi:hypothetical protein